MNVVSVHLSPVYSSKPVCSSNVTKCNVCHSGSISQLIKPLNVSKSVCSSKATKRNVCNASIVSQFTKTLNVSKPLCSSKATKHNVCNTSSVSKLIKPFNVSKTVCPNNTNGCNVCKVSSVSQLVKPSTVSKLVLSTKVHNICNVSRISQLIKTINVNKSVCSSNAINSAICNSTCKPVSNFVSDCQSVKHVRKLIDVNQKCPHEQLVTNKDNRQHDFTKPNSVVNILMMSIYFYELILLFFYISSNFAITMLTIFSKAMSRLCQVSITSDNNAFFLIIVFVIFRVFNRK